MMVRAHYYQQVDLRVGVVILFVITALLQKSDSVNDALEIPANVNCACPEETLIYTCNIVGGGNTLWGGTAFNCPSTTNEIILRHSQFSEGGSSGSCSNGALMARSIGVTNTDCYTSELQVTVSTTLNNTTIQCIHDSIDSGQRMIGSVSTLMVASALDPPDSFKMVNIRGGQAILEWIPVISVCSLINYTITSNCSSCSSGITNSTTISCLIPQPNATSGAIICAFSVQSMVCGDLSGRSSMPVVVTIPAQPPSVNIIPHYSNNDNSLTKLRILGKDLLIATSDGTTLFITEYNVIYFDPTTKSIVDSEIVNTCSQESCETSITTPTSITSLCPFIINVTANDGFGQRLLSDPVTIRCTNQFVKVQYDSATSIITCTFLNKLDTSDKSCHVRYGSCDQPQTETTQKNSSSSKITLTLTSQNLFCYTVTASNSTFTIAIEGDTAVGGTGASAGLIGGVIVAVVAVVLLILLAVAILLYFSRRKRRSGQRDIVFSKSSIEVKLNLQKISPDRFKIHRIENSCKLREAAPFKRGYAYYEFKHEKENIEDKEIILMHKGNGQFFTPDVTRDTLRQFGLLGEGVARPSHGFENYTVFVQSTGSGARHLPAGSTLLYDQERKSPWEPNDKLLVKLTSKQFDKSNIESEITLEAFRNEHGLEQNKCNVFLELCDVDRKKVVNIRDALLMEKNGDLFTGPGARFMADNPTPNTKWRIFILGQFDKKTPLNVGTTVIHQNPHHIKDQFYVLKVEENNVQMSDFIEEKFEKKFENGRAFYEFTESEEDLLSYKEVVRIPKSIYEKKQSGEECKDQSERDYAEECLETRILFYYSFQHAPGVGIKPPRKSAELKMFVQSTSQGSRCLKENTLLLYKVNA